MGHPRDADELLEVSGDELRSVVGDDPWFCLRILLPSSLQDDFDFRFGHRFPQIPMDDRTAKALQNAAQVVEGAAHVDVGNIDMPMLVRVGWLLEEPVELAGSHTQPVDESSGADFRLFRPAPDEIHYQVPHVMRHPHFGQSSPRLFFKAMCSAINSASTSSLV